MGATATEFHLERDADHCAVARHHDPLALASAICKAAGAHTPAMASLAGPCGLGSRVDEQLEDPQGGGGTVRGRALSGLAAAVTALALLLVGAVPLAAATGLTGDREATERHCA